MNDLLKLIEDKLADRARHHITYGNVYRCKKPKLHPPDEIISGCSECGDGTDEQRSKNFMNSERSQLVTALFDLLDNPRSDITWRP